MNVALASLFRNSAGFHIQRYFHQVARFADALERHHHTLHLKMVWGDSTDRTPVELQDCAKHLMQAIDTVKSFELIERSHGGPVYGSTEEVDRLKALSYVANGVFESIGSNIDALIYVESDLIWQPAVFIRLLGKLKGHVDVVAPMTFAGTAFYDIWGFRGVDGERFGPFEPFHRDLKFNELTEVSSVGSCLVMRGDVARRSRIRNDYGLVGFCEDARNNGFSVWADAQERIHHP
jgi:hypothetical protein